MVDSVTTSRFQAADLRVETKPDLTPVSDADKAAEELVRTQLRRTRPRVAEGGVDVATEPRLELYDMAALVPVVVEAGGRFTSLDGDDGPFGGSAVASNGLVHDAVVTALSS